MMELEVLVLKLRSIDALAASAIALVKVSALDLRQGRGTHGVDLCCHRLNICILGSRRDHKNWCMPTKP
jgi:hypothetical protein